MLDNVKFTLLSVGYHYISLKCIGLRSTDSSLVDQLYHSKTCFKAFQKVDTDAHLASLLRNNPFDDSTK